MYLCLTTLHPPQPVDGNLLLCHKHEGFLFALKECMMDEIGIWPSEVYVQDETSVVHLLNFSDRRGVWTLFFKIEILF